MEVINVSQRNYLRKEVPIHQLKVLLGTSIFQTKGFFYGYQGDELVNGLNSVDVATIENLVPVSIYSHISCTYLSHS